MSTSKKIILSVIIIAGLRTPFVPELTIIEMFFLLYPFGIIVSITFIYLVISLFSKLLDTKNALFIFSLIPIFLLTQVASSVVVGKVQKLRSKEIIKEISSIKEQTENYPDEHQIPFGISYQRLADSNGFQLKYSRGFFITEKYDSRDKKWEIRGWND